MGTENTNQPEQTGLPVEGQSPESGLGNSQGSSLEEKLKAEQDAKTGQSATPEAGKETPEEDLTFIPEDVDEDLQPLFTETNKRMQSAFNKKMTELAEKNKDKLVFSSYDELLQNQEFMSWAEKQMQANGYQNPNGDIRTLSLDDVARRWDSLSDYQKRDYVTTMDPSKRDILSMKLQMQTMQRNSYLSKEKESEHLATKKFGDAYTKRKDAVGRLKEEVKRTPYISHEEAYKILDYEEFGKRMYSAGLSKGRSNVQDIQNLPPIPGEGGGYQGGAGGAKSIEDAFNSSLKTHGEGG